MIGGAALLSVAAMESEGFLIRWRADGFGFLGLSPFSWALLLLVAALVAWAYLIRKRGKERSRRYSRYGYRPGHHRRHRRTGLFGLRRRRRRHRAERPRNPTLAETGGLPPPKTGASGTPEI